MAKKKLILIPSEKMDRNRKTDRDEHSLIRMSKSARSNMGLDTSVEVFPIGGKQCNAISLNIFQAFVVDLRQAKIAGIQEKDLCRVGFVTSDTYRKITGKESKECTDIWVTDDEEVVNIMIGTDPEFILFDVDKNTIKKANEVLAFNGSIGCDGAMAELRPKPSDSPEGLASNIKQILADNKLVSKIEPYLWKAGCYYKDPMRDYPIGGHIHFGNPKSLTKIPAEKRYEFFQTLNKILDELLSIPMIKMDGSELGQARRTKCAMSPYGGYGFFGEWRPCNGHFEHRTLSGMWLMHPELAVAVFGTAKAIAEEVFKYVIKNKLNEDYMFPSKFRKHNKWSPQAKRWASDIWKDSFDGWAEIPLAKDMGCTMSSRDMVTFLHGSDDNKITLKFLNSWYTKLKKMSTYKTYAEYIDTLYEILKNKTTVFQNYKKGLKQTWLDGAKFLD